MNTYRVAYRHTEYRQIEVTAASEAEAFEKYLNGDGFDEFVCSGNDQHVLSIDMEEDE